MAEPIAKTTRKEESILLLTRILSAGLVAASVVIGWQAFVIAGAVTTGLYTYRQCHRKNNREEELLDLFRNDIAVLQNKDPDSVTLDDMRKAAAPLSEGGQGVIAIHKQLEYDSNHQKIRITSEVVSALMIVGSLVGAAFLMPELLNLRTVSVSNIMFGITVAGAMAFGNKVVDAVADTMFGNRELDRGISPALIEIAEQMTHEPIKPVQVFNIIAETNPILQGEIKQRYGSEFRKLAIAKKESIVADYEAGYRVQALTREINNNNIRPSLIGFIAYGQTPEELPEYKKYTALFRQPVIPASHTGGIDTISKYVERLREERTDIHAAPQVIH